MSAHPTRPPETRPRVPARPADFGYSTMMPRLWHGMTFRAWRNLSRGQWGRHPGDLRPGLYASVTALSLGNSLMKGLSDAIYGRALAKVEIAPDPVFVLGYWRSGTTWLHQLLSCDPRFCAPTSLQVFMPETFLVLSSAMRPLKKLWLPESRPMDNVALETESSEEDEVALAIMGAPSVLSRTAFGDRDAPAMADDLAYLPEALRADWQHQWLRFLTAVQLQSPGKQLLLKSPAHTMRLPEILRVFPKARFVHIIRNPYEIFVSNVKTVHAMTATQTLRRSMPDREDVVDSMLNTFRLFQAAVERDRALIPEGQYTMIRYEDLVRDTKSVIRGVYDDLDLGTFADLEPGLDRIIAGREGYRPNDFHLEPALARRIEAEWHEYFQRYGYRMTSDQASEAE